MGDVVSVAPVLLRPSSISTTVSLRELLLLLLPSRSVRYGGGGGLLLLSRSVLLLPSRSVRRRGGGGGGLANAAPVDLILEVEEEEDDAEPPASTALDDAAAAKEDGLLYAARTAAALAARIAAAATAGELGELEPGALLFAARVNVVAPVGERGNVVEAEEAAAGAPLPLAERTEEAVRNEVDAAVAPSGATRIVRPRPCCVCCDADVNTGMPTPYVDAIVSGDVPAPLVMASMRGRRALCKCSME